MVRDDPFSQSHLLLLLSMSMVFCCGCQSLPFSTSSFVLKQTTESKPSQPTGPVVEKKSPSPYNAQANDLVEQALAHYSNGELKQAKVLLASARKIDPGHIGTFEIDAQLSYDMGNRNHFLKSLRAIRAASPHDSEKQSAIGTLFFQAGQTQEGIACLQRAVELKPNNEDYSLKLAAFYEQSGMTSESQKVLMRALHDSPGSKRLPIALGRVCEANQQWKEASVYYAMVVNHFPKNHVWRKQQARCLYYSGNYSSAFEQFEICQKKHPESLSLSEMVAFGDTALRLGKLEKAESLFDEISTAHQHQLLHVEILRGLCAINRGQKDSAKTIIDTARRKWPADPTLTQVAALLPDEK